MMFKAMRWTAVGLGCVVLATLGCGAAFNSSDVIVLTHVNVPAGSGSASVMFQAIKGQQLLISLTGKLTTMEPAALLVGPNAGQTDAVPASGSSNGFNSAQVTIPQDGTYRLDISDGSGHGGAVTVRVEVATG